jgi:hypothetical protein
MEKKIISKKRKLKMNMHEDLVISWGEMQKLERKNMDDEIKNEIQNVVNDYVKTRNKGQKTPNESDNDGAKILKITPIDKKITLDANGKSYEFDTIDEVFY